MAVSPSSPRAKPAGAGLRAERAGADVALDELGVLLEVVLVRGLDRGGRQGRLESRHVGLAVAGNADHQERALARGGRERQHDVLERVSRDPLAIGAGVRVVGHGDERRDRRGVGRVLDVCGRSVGDVESGRDSRRHCLDVGRVAAGRAHVRVLPHLGGRQELLGLGAAHRARLRLHHHERDAEAVEDAHISLALQLVRALEALVVDVEAVRVLHDELAAAQQARAGARLVAVLGLDLVDRERQVLVRRVQVLDQQREHLLVRGREQVVAALAVREAEEVGAVLGPAAGDLVGLARQQGREVHLLTASGVHLFADHALDLGKHLEAKREPRVDAWSRAADVPGADQQPMRGDLGVGGVFTERAEKESRHAEHEAKRSRARSRLLLSGPPALPPCGTPPQSRRTSAPLSLVSAAPPSLTPAAPPSLRLAKAQNARLRKRCALPRRAMEPQVRNLRSQEGRQTVELRVDPDVGVYCLKVLPSAGASARINPEGLDNSATVHLTTVAPVARMRSSRRFSIHSTSSGARPEGFARPYFTRPSNSPTTRGAAHQKSTRPASPSSSCISCWRSGGDRPRSSITTADHDSPGLSDCRLASFTTRRARATPALPAIRSHIEASWASVAKPLRSATSAAATPVATVNTRAQSRTARDGVATIQSSSNSYSSDAAGPTICTRSAGRRPCACGASACTTRGGEPRSGRPCNTRAAGPVTTRSVPSLVRSTARTKRRKRASLVASTSGSA